MGRKERTAKTKLCSCMTISCVGQTKPVCPQRKLHNQRFGPKGHGTSLLPAKPCTVASRGGASWGWHFPHEGGISLGVDFGPCLIDRWHPWEMGGGVNHRFRGA